MTKRLLLLTQILTLALVGVWAQGPNNSNTYYQSATNKKGEALKTALFNIIKNPSVTSYDGLLEKYKQTDTRPDGYVRDWYSNTTNFTHIKDKAGNYTKEGDVYNREHLLPQSWFGSGDPKSDIIQVVPTDGYVNNRRGNYPFGENNGETYKSNNGYSKLGACTVNGYSDRCFEPSDEVKGDIARIYFYMATCYQNEIASWSSDVINGTAYQPFAKWHFDMLVRWSKLDPVDEVEIARNNACYEVQHNRNPFVDYPGLEDFVWGDKKNETFYYDNYSGIEGFVSMPTFSPASGTRFSESLSVSINCSTTGATIRYTIDGTTPNSTSTAYTSPITLTETTTVKAIAFDSEGNASNVATATYTKATNPQPVEGDGTFIFNTDEGLEALGITKPEPGKGTEISLMTLVSGGILMTSTDGSTNTRVWNSNGNTNLRAYKDATLTFTSETPIVKIVFDPATSALSGLTNGEWNGNSKSITFTVTGNRADINTITVTTGEAQKQDVTMTFSQTAVTAELGQPFTAPTLTMDPIGLNVIYESSNTAVATVDNDGNVTLEGEGETTITATFEGNDDYNPASASYTLTVTLQETPPIEGELMYESFSGYTGTQDGSANINTTDDKLDYKDWNSFTNVYFGIGACGKMSSSKSNGAMTTKAISLTGKGTLTFKLKKYSNEAGSLALTIAGATADATNFTAPNDWTESTVNLTEATGSVTLTFTATKRLYIDDIKLVKVNEEMDKETESISISSVGYATLYYGDKNLEVPAGVTAYTYKVSGGELNVSTTYGEGDIIPAGTGVILEAGAGDYEFVVSDEGGLFDEDNMLKGSDEETVVDASGYTYYILSNGTKGVGFYYGKVDGEDSPHAITNKAHKAYLAVPDEEAGAKTSFVFSEMPTDIVAPKVHPDKQATYNLQGQRMNVNGNTMPKGIYITGGKKYVVR